MHVSNISFPGCREIAYILLGADKERVSKLRCLND